MMIRTLKKAAYSAGWAATAIGILGIDARGLNGWAVPTAWAGMAVVLLCRYHDHIEYERRAYEARRLRPRRDEG